MICDRIFTNSPLRNFSYIIYSEDNKKPHNVYCIDPWDSQQIISHLEKRGLKLSHIINTHEHFDHIRGNDGLVEFYNAKIWAHPNAEGLIPNMDRGLQAGEKIHISNASYFEVMDTPGHTFAHISLLLHQKEHNNNKLAVICGDTFFNAGVGRCDSGGDPNILYESISEQFNSLADHTYIYPGHDYMYNNLGFTLKYEKNNQHAREILKKYEKDLPESNQYQPSTIAIERQINLFLRLHLAELRLELAQYYPNLSQNSSDREVFLALRQLRNTW